MNQLKKWIRVTVMGGAFVLAHLTAQAGGLYANEAKDFGVSETKYPKRNNYGSATPMKVPGATTVTTDELKEMLAKEPKPVLIDALGASTMIADAQGYGDGIGEGAIIGKDKDLIPKALQAWTSGDKSKPIVFYCRSSSCWHSYNASLHALEMGYTNVFWYRGGIDAWKDSGGKVVPFVKSKDAM